MEASEALKIIESLADGVDPYTGELFPHDSPYQNPQTVRALFLAIRALERLEARKRREQHLPENAGKPWNSEEVERLLKSFDSGMIIRQLADEHMRTEGAMSSRLIRLGRLIPGSGATTPL